MSSTSDFDFHISKVINFHQTRPRDTRAESDVKMHPTLRWPASLPGRLRDPRLTVKSCWLE